ncbi:MAG: hydrogenase expression protein [SAR202 cluster bacterium]|nr:hydrogenase expression protein [SAR202 cluster bacterium]
MPDNPVDRHLRPGKLPPDLLAKFLSGLTTSEKRVLLGPNIGEDSAFISFGSSTLIAKSDPITFATDRIGWYAIQVNANDIAASGGTPKWFLSTLLLPEDEKVSNIKDIFEQMREAADELGVSIIGGHTEITTGLSRPIIAGTMLGEAAPSETIKTSSAEPGDDVILTSGIAVEGTAILARESKTELLAAGVSEDEIKKAANLLNVPGISIVKPAQVAMSTGEVTAMHDPTEGGLAGAIDELARASGTGVTIDDDQVLIFDETKTICKALFIEPWGLIASGSLIITAHRNGSPNVIRALRQEGIEANVIGKITDHKKGMQRIKKGELQPLPKFERDEIARYFETLDS